MSNRPQSGSLAFLDVMTCSLAGVFLLFFSILAIKKHLAFVGGDEQQASSGETSGSPFIIVVSISAPGPLFEGSGTWMIPESTMHLSQTAGEDFAVCYGAGPLSTNGIIQLGPLSKAARFSVQILYEGETRAFRPDASITDFPRGNGGQGFVQLWPITNPK
jgi:hypothetical protein